MVDHDLAILDCNLHCLRSDVDGGRQILDVVCSYSNSNHMICQNTYQLAFVWGRNLPPVPGGNFAKASSVGANPVNGPAHFSASTKAAAPNAATGVLNVPASTIPNIASSCALLTLLATPGMMVRFAIRVLCARHCRARVTP